MGPAALVLSTVEDGEAELPVADVPVAELPEAEPVGVAAELAAELVLSEAPPEEVGRAV